MLISAPNTIATSASPDAAMALIAVPAEIVKTAALASLQYLFTGESVSRAQLVRDYVATTSPDMAKTAMLAAVEGARSAQPEIEPLLEGMLQSVDGVAALLTEAAADTNKADALSTIQEFATTMAQTSAPLLEAAMLLGASPSALNA